MNSIRTGVMMMGIVSHDYKIFSFTSDERPSAWGGVLTLNVVPKTPNHAFNGVLVEDQASGKRDVAGMLADETAKNIQEVKLKITVDGKTDFPSGAYKICGLTEFDGKLHNVEIYVSAGSADADYVKLTQCLPLITLKLPDTKIG